MPTYPPISARLSPADLIALRKLFPGRNRTKAISGCISELTNVREQVAKRMAKGRDAAARILASIGDDK